MELRRSVYDYDLLTNRKLRSEPNNLTMSSPITFIGIDTTRADLVIGRMNILFRILW
jgi:hypothetical protein